MTRKGYDRLRIEVCSGGKIICRRWVIGLPIEGSVIEYDLKRAYDAIEFWLAYPATEPGIIDDLADAIELVEMGVTV